MIRLFIVLLAFGFSSSAFAQDKVFNASYYTLDNGLEIVVIPNHRAPVVTHMVWYRTGAADEAPGKSGIAHFLEHLMFKGSTGFGPGQFSETVRALGGNDNAFTSQDYTAYYQSVASRYLELVMRMEAGRMRGLAPPLAEVESERNVILEERRQRTDNDPQARFAEPLDAALFVNHPYGTPVIGWFHEMETLSWDDAKTFYDHYYGPNNAILVVSGDVEPDQVYTLAKDIYGPLERINVPPRVRTKSPPLPGENLIIMHDPAVREPGVQIALRVPSASQDKQAALALEIIQDILGNGSTSRLYRSLVIEQKLASSAGAYYSDDAIDDGQFSLYAAPLPGITPEQISTALETELAKLVSEGVSASELRESKSRMKNEAVYARDSLAGPAMIIGRALATGSTLDDVEYWPENISAISADQILSTAQTWLDPTKTRIVTGYLLPQEIKQETSQQEAAPQEPALPPQAPQEVEP